MGYLQVYQENIMDGDWHNLFHILRKALNKFKVTNCVNGKKCGETEKRKWIG